MCVCFWCKIASDAGSGYQRGPDLSSRPGGWGALFLLKQPARQTLTSWVHPKLQFVTQRMLICYDLGMSMCWFCHILRWPPDWIKHTRFSEMKSRVETASGLGIEPIDSKVRKQWLRLWATAAPIAGVKVRNMSSHFPKMPSAPKAQVQFQSLFWTNLTKAAAGFWTFVFWFVFVVVKLHRISTWNHQNGFTDSKRT